MPFPWFAVSLLPGQASLEAAGVSAGAGVSQRFQLGMQCPKHFWGSIGYESFAELRDPAQDFPVRPVEVAGVKKGGSWPWTEAFPTGTVAVVAMAMR